VDAGGGRGATRMRQGWTTAQHLESGSGWVVRAHQIEYLQPAFAGDRITVRTWWPT